MAIYRMQFARTNFVVITLLNVAITVTTARCAEEDIKVPRTTLVSRNRPPIIKGKVDTEIYWPPGFDSEEQVRIAKELERIVSTGTKEFADLISLFDDDRYCCTIARNGGWYNFTVGDMAYFIVAKQVEIYRRHPTLLGQCLLPGSVPSGRVDAAKWWTKMAQKSLPELQAIAAMQVVDQLRLDFATFADKCSLSREDVLRALLEITEKIEAGQEWRRITLGMIVEGEFSQKE